ncbi:tail protein X [Photobacterium sp. R1]
MATTYRTRDGDMLDDICWRHYGRENAVEAVLAMNPGLADFGPLLPSGIEIKLPDLAVPVSEEAVSLWD